MHKHPEDRTLQVTDITGKVAVRLVLILFTFPYSYLILILIHISEAKHVTAAFDSYCPFLQSYFTS